MTSMDGEGKVCFLRTNLLKTEKKNKNQTATKIYFCEEGEKERKREGERI